MRTDTIGCSHNPPCPSPTARRGAEHYGDERLETDVATAERILREELKARRWQAADLAKRAKGDLGKVQIAGRLREATPVTVKWTGIFHS